MDYLNVSATGDAAVENSLRFALRGGLFDLPMATSGSSRHTVPVFGELQVAHQVCRSDSIKSISTVAHTEPIVRVNYYLPGNQRRARRGIGF